MGTLLSFFTTGATAPARIQALLIGAMVMLATCLALTTWAEIERSGRFQAERDAAVYKAQSGVLVDKLATCSGSVDTLASLGKAIRGDLHAALEDFGKANAPLKKELASIGEAVKKPPPVRPDGKPTDCSDAWRRIEKGVQP
jgi:hypothetical protein